MPANNNNNSSSNSKSSNAHQLSAIQVERLQELYQERERTIKLELAIVSLLWLVGCPVVCVLFSNDDSLYGKPQEDFCGLYGLSISSSMTGLYPKIWGSIMAPIFGLLIVQRTSSGLCSNLKLGWLMRFSPLVYATTDGRKNHNALQDSSTTHNSNDTAILLWKHIERIEYLGYFASGCLVALVAFDSKDFPLLHMALATFAFFLLYRQNFLVGTLGLTFGEELFPNWTNERARRLFYLGMWHLVTVYAITFSLGTINNRGYCEGLASALERTSIQLFGKSHPSTLMWILSIFCWGNEYAFCFLAVFIQLFEHFELRLWEFVGSESMPYMLIISRCSIREAFTQVLSTDFGDSEHVHTLLEMEAVQKEEKKTK